jgi:hypothetical protein
MLALGEHSLCAVGAVAKSAEFNFWGFLFVMLAAIMSGFRWTVTQILLQVVICICSTFILFPN